MFLSRMLPAWSLSKQSVSPYMNFSSGRNLKNGRYMSQPNPVSKNKSVRFSFRKSLSFPLRLIMGFSPNIT